MHTHRRSPSSSAFDLDARVRGRTAVLPFLPTLAIALVIAIVSLWCPKSGEPAFDAATLPPAPVMVSQGIEAFPTAPMIAPVLEGIPATQAFGKLYPLTAMPAGEVQSTAALPRNSARVAGTARRACAPGRCGEGRKDANREAAREGFRDVARNTSAPTRYMPDPPTVSAISDPFRDERTPNGESLPDDVLPFMPTAASVLDTARSLGGKAVSISGSVASTVGDLL